MSKLHNWTNKKIKEVLNNPYGRTDRGTDYEAIKSELQAELWKREERGLKQEFDRLERESEYRSDGGF